MAIRVASLREERQERLGQLRALGLEVDDLTLAATGLLMLFALALGGALVVLTSRNIAGGGEDEVGQLARLNALVLFDAQVRGVVELGTMASLRPLELSYLEQSIRRRSSRSRTSSSRRPIRAWSDRGSSWSRPERPSSFRPRTRRWRVSTSPTSWRTCRMSCERPSTACSSWRALCGTTARATSQPAKLSPRRSSSTAAAICST